MDGNTNGESDLVTQVRHKYLLSGVALATLTGISEMSIVRYSKGEEIQNTAIKTLLILCLNVETFDNLFRLRSSQLTPSQREITQNQINKLQNTINAEVHSYRQSLLT